MNIKSFRVVSFICILCVISSCNRTVTQPEQAIAPPKPLTPYIGPNSANIRKSFYSTVRPCFPTEDGTYLNADLQTLLSKAKRLFNDTPLAEIELPQAGERSVMLPPATPNDSGIVVPYAISDSVTNPVMVAGFGYGFNVIDAAGILWYEDGAWKSQPYPQAESEVASQRDRALTGSNSAFCSGLVIEVHQRGNLLAVVADLGYGGTGRAEEAQLLERKGETWKVAWVPTYENSKMVSGARVEFQDGIDSFVVYHEDSKTAPQQTEVWKLQGSQYVKVESE